MLQWIKINQRRVNTTMKLILPENYDPVLDLRQTQEAIKYIRDTFQKEIGKVLGVSRISAPCTPFL